MEKAVLGCGRPQPRRDTCFDPFQPPPTPTSATECAVERGSGAGEGCCISSGTKRVVSIALECHCTNTEE